MEENSKLIKTECQRCGVMFEYERTNAARPRGRRRLRCPSCEVKHTRKKAYEYSELRKMDALMRADAYLETHPCVDCGCADKRVLQFDHVRGARDYSPWSPIGQTKWEREVAKCDVRCANCHIIRHKTHGQSGKEAFENEQDASS